MLKNTDKLKARFDKYDRLSIIICCVLLAINLLSIFYLKKYIFIGSIIPLVFFLIIKNVKVNNRAFPIDDIDLFYFKVNGQLNKYSYYIILLHLFFCFWSIISFIFLI